MKVNRQRKKTLMPSSRITEEGFTDANLSCGVEICGVTIRQYLEDHPRTCKWVGSHAFISHVHGHLEGELPNLTGMILHVWYCNNMWCVLYFFGIPSILDIWWHMFGYLDICFIGVLFLLLACCAWLHLAYNQKTTVKQDSPIHLPSTIESFIIQLSIIISFAWCTLSTMKAPCQHPLQHKNPSKTSAWTCNHLTMFQAATPNQQRYQLWPPRDSSTFAERWNPFP